MLYGLIADLVLVAHLAFVAFVALGGFLVWRRRWLAWIHVPVALWGMIISYVGFTCPLTPLENWLRTLGGRSGYQGGFLEHYVIALLYPAGLTRKAQIALGTAVLAVNLAIYWRSIVEHRRGRAARSD